jgi:hypothetical protein
MKKAFLILLSMTLTLSAVSQNGKVIDNLSMTSKILKMERKYAIYISPPIMKRRREVIPSLSSSWCR